jgi:hypothetical protein
MLYILVQAACGEMSHFNNSTPFYSTMYSLMGAGAVLMVLFFCLYAALATWTFIQTVQGQTFLG